MNILTDKGSLPSAKLLRDTMVQMTGKKIYVSTEPERLTKAPTFRYGCSAGNFSDDTLLNSPGFIRLCSDKKAFADLLRNENINAPEFLHIREGEGRFPIVVRETLTSSGGRGIHVVRNRQELEPFRFNSHWWWTPFVRTRCEYRIHVLGGQVARVFAKVREDGREEEEFPIRNLSNGYHFSLRFEPRPELTELAGMVDNHLPDGAGFYTLDVGYIGRNEGFIVFEANTAPGLNETSATAYAEFLLRAIGMEVASGSVPSPEQDDLSIVW